MHGAKVVMSAGLILTAGYNIWTIASGNPDLGKMGLLPIMFLLGLIAAHISKRRTV